MNVISIAGRLGADPEIKTTQGGTVILRMRVAISERKKVQGEWQDSTLWLTAIAFGKRAEGLNKILSKGDPVAINGRLEVRDFERKDGTKGTAVEVVANDVTLMGSKRGGQSQRNDTPRSQGGDPYAPPADDFADGFPDDDSIPF